jgi:hypothetical protein
MAVGRWDTEWRVLNITYRDYIRILGLQMSPTIERSMEANWTHIVESVRVKAREEYTRDLMSQQIQFAQMYLLAKIWHTAQIFPIPQGCVRRLM